MSYPSVGGIVTGRFTGAELEWLGFPRVSRYSEVEVPAGDDEEFFEKENAFAFRMMQLGARWWPSREFEAKHDTLDYPYGYHYPPDVHVGYSSQSTQSSPSSEGKGNAVIILKTFAGNSPLRLPEHDAPEKPEDWSRLAACRTMQERCDVLRDFGASEYADISKCPDTPQSLEEGVAEGRRYEALLRKMEDMKYLDEWLMSL